MVKINIIKFLTLNDCSCFERSWYFEPNRDTSKERNFRQTFEYFFGTLQSFSKSFIHGKLNIYNLR